MNLLENLKFAAGTLRHLYKNIAARQKSGVTEHDMGLLKVAIPYLEEAAKELEPKPAPKIPAKATHQCIVCDAFWRKNEDGSWSLAESGCRECCDNAPMIWQIRPLDTDLLVHLMHQMRAYSAMRNSGPEDYWRLRAAVAENAVAVAEKALRDSSAQRVLDHFASPGGNRRPEGGEQFPNLECCQIAHKGVERALSTLTEARAKVK